MRLPALMFACGLLATPALAAPPSPPPSTAATIPLQEQQDIAVVQKAMKSASLRDAMVYSDDLRGVLNHAPAAYPQVEQQADHMIIRVPRGDAGLNAALFAALAKGSRDIRISFNTYGMAAFLLGSMANEARDPRLAITYLDRGLALQPDNMLLVTEKGAAFAMLRRFSDALDLYQAAEKTMSGLDDAIDPTARPRLLRAKGFALIELNRLDEAQAAYEAALKLEPGHAGAKGELDYIKKLRGGEPVHKYDLFTGDKAKGDGAAPAQPAAKP